MTLASRPGSALQISEVFLSLQGEGPSAGTPAHFIRLQGCDVGCQWCDTKYAWDPDQGRALDLPELWSAAQALGAAPLVVITGGEPLEHPAFGDVLALALARWARVEVETSGILPPLQRDERLSWNVSPKLPAAGGRWNETWRHVAAWVAEPRATFKLVIADAADLAEARARLTAADVPRARVMYMPEGLTEPALRDKAAWLAPACVADGVRMSPRLHIWLWGAKRGV